jgi:transcriptional regulator with XRE-family HTH domain
LAEIYKTEEFKNDWANQVRFHVARNVLHLRRYRRMSQTKVGQTMGTSQSAVARIESGQENITLDTLQRLVVSLKGRFHVSIAPQEYLGHPQPLWWEAIESAPWSIVRAVGRRTVENDQLIVGLERPHGEFFSEGTTHMPGVHNLLTGGTMSVLGKV